MMYCGNFLTELDVPLLVCPSASWAGDQVALPPTALTLGLHWLSGLGWRQRLWVLVWRIDPEEAHAWGPRPRLACGAR